MDYSIRTAFYLQIDILLRCIFPIDSRIMDICVQRRVTNTNTCVCACGISKKGFQFARLFLTTWLLNIHMLILYLFTYLLLTILYDIAYIYLTIYAFCIAHSRPCTMLQPWPEKTREKAAGFQLSTRSASHGGVSPLLPCESCLYPPPPGKKHVPWVEGIVSTEQHDKKWTLFMSQKVSQQKGPAFSEIRWCCVLVSFKGRIMTALCPAHKVQTSLSDKRKVPGSLEVLSHEMIFCIMSMSTQYIFKRFNIFIISIFI